MPQTLEQKITALIELGNYLPEVPLYLKNNLSPSFELRPYQAEAFSRFLYYLRNEKLCQKPTQLLFHMATGSGKTLIMAGAIIHLYKLGYRNFLFFVHSTNIINKTRENFLNPISAKYLFSGVISFEDKKVTIREVDNFQSGNEEDINIVFSTIQGLHSRLNTPRENSITYDDFENKKVVLISDEAHHINIETKQGKKMSLEEQEEIKSWEGTVNRIFRSCSDNILLEFTATEDLDDQNIFKKYFDKILFDYSLKQYRIDGYSKEILVLQADLAHFERALQAILISQYRQKIFEKNKLRIKPVILFKSRTIIDSRSFFKEFIEKIKHLTIKEILNIKNNAKKYESSQLAFQYGLSLSILNKAFEYYDRSNITLENLIFELKEDFSENKCIVVNSKEESEAKQIAVNTLEDENNHFRAVFAVDKLNEGWDVLNLFDIVRLYDTRDAAHGKPGKTTMSEAQLIGRGARYCPFQAESGQPKYQRKYDYDLENELRICEELYYHSAYNPKYIQELNTALQEIGIKPKETKEIQLQLKDTFKDTDFYKNGLIFKNNQLKNDRLDIFKIPDSLTHNIFHVNLQTGFTKSTVIFESSDIQGRKTNQKDYYLFDFGEAIIRKAINKLEFYRFCNLVSFLPNIKSISEFINSESYLKKIQIEIEGADEQIMHMTPDVKLAISIGILSKISSILISDKVEFKGSSVFYPYEVNKIFKDKTINVSINEDGDKELGIPQSSTTNTDLQLDLRQENWYAFIDNYGTSEEKYLVKFIHKAYKNLKEKYEEIYLLRNERHFQLFSFDDGNAIEPDFVLFLKKKESDISFHYQVFIESKGEHLLKYDEWKEKFLISLKEKSLIDILWKTKKYIIWGLPFYNENITKPDFAREFNKLLE